MLPGASISISFAFAASWASATVFYPDRKNEGGALNLQALSGCPRSEGGFMEANMNCNVEGGEEPGAHSKLQEFRMTFFWTQA